MLVPGCIPVTEVEDSDLKLSLDFSKDNTRRLYDLQDKLEVDSLIANTASDLPEVRYQSVLSFGSVIAPSAINALIQRLNDPVIDIRRAAAYALGQQKAANAKNALIQAFNQQDTTGVYHGLNAAILESIGKIGDNTDLTSLVNISTYSNQDTTLLLGQVRGIYQMMLRDIKSQEAQDKMLAYVLDDEKPTKVRLLAAHEIYRSKEPIDTLSSVLLRPFSANLDVDFKIALANLLNNFRDSLKFGLVKQVYLQNSNTYVRSALINSLSNVDYEVKKDFLLQAVKNYNVHVANTAAKALFDLDESRDAYLFWRMAKDSINNRARYGLYKAALKHMPIYNGPYKRYISSELNQVVVNSEKEFDKVEAIRAMSPYAKNYVRLIEIARNNVSIPVSMAALEALSTIARNKKLPLELGYGLPNFKNQILILVEEILQEGDFGKIAMVADILKQPHLDFVSTYAAGVDKLKMALKKLELPKEIEAYYVLEETIKYFDPNYQVLHPQPNYNHPINWDIFLSLQPNVKVELKTVHGIILIDLLEDVAPATVTTFVDNVRRGFYDGKVFHRIIPGFVSQGGCPRGDGYGTLDFTMRTETPIINYDEGGFVGVASAGRHTEGVQFFFTHTATPHLDGRYTIFAKIVKGMDVLAKLETGDKMEMRLR